VVKVVQKLVLRNEVVKVRGRVKVITIKKEDFFKVLKLTKLRVLDKEYEALMPPVDSLEKNTIDVNGLATLVQQYMTFIIFASGNTNGTAPAEMVLTTSSGNITLSYTGNINLNSQGVTVYMQVLQQNGNYSFEYYYIGFDTTSDSYTTSQLELYVSAYVTNQNAYATTMFTDTVRIAYTNTSFSKASNSYLFVVWLIAFQNIPPYLVYFTPVLQNNVGIIPQSYLTSSTGNTVYFNNSSCSFGCGGNCPSTNLRGFITYIQNNSVVLEFPVIAPLGTGVSSVEILLCDQIYFKNLPAISGSISSTVTPPVSGATFYVAIVTITVTYQGS
jgi:hypothetical protein